MQQPEPIKPIVTIFRAASRLMYEWRDTATIGAAAVLGCGIERYFHLSPFAAIATVAAVAALRENTRSGAWIRTPDLRERQPSSLPSVQQCRTSAIVGGNTANAVFVFAVSNLLFNNLPTADQQSSGQLLQIAPAFVGLIFAGAVSTSFAIRNTLRTGGPKPVFRAYRDIMWDHPRKRAQSKQTAKPFTPGGHRP